MSEAHVSKKQSAPMDRQQAKGFSLAPSDGEALIPEENASDYDLKREESVKPPITSVPMWLYKEKGLCGFTKAATAWWMNFICFLAHTAFLVVSVFFSVRDDGSLETPSLTVYTTRLTWVAGQTDALIPKFEKTGGIPLPILVIAFFGLSALAHGTVAVFNRKQAFATGFIVAKFNEESTKVSSWTGWYFVGLHRCTNVLRWIEYSFSASVMAVVFAVAGGINHIYMLLMIVALIWTTMTYGWFSEVVCPPKDLGNDTRPKYWLKNNTNTHTLWLPAFGARFNRLIPHIMGYVPYLFVWVILIHSFVWNTSDAPEGGGPPTFVYFIVFGQAAAFTLFGITQFVLLWREDGAYWFFWGKRLNFTLQCI